MMRLVLLLPVLLSAADISFVPPGPMGRRAAIGDFSDRPAVEQAAFTPDTCFKPIPMPGPDDWLANHEEAGETFDEFTADKFPRPTLLEKYLHVQPFGSFGKNAPDLKLLKEYTEIFFDTPVVFLKGQDEKALSFMSRVNRGSSLTQYLTDDYIRWMADHKPKKSYAVIGITMQDLYPAPDWNFVFGMAHYVERTGIFSFARYNPVFYDEDNAPDADKTILIRAIKVMTHEIGHMYGLPHCVHFSCLMNGSNHMEESDRSPLHLCPVCLRKLRHQVGFDILDRYRKLYAFYIRNGIKEGKDFTAGRIARLKSVGK